MQYEPHFIGSAFQHWIGVVEDRNDPQQLGRVRIRILGAHTENKALIPTSDLHWAYVYSDITSAGMNGIGRSPTGVVEGTWCFGFWRDTDAKQDPVVLGVMHGIPLDPPNTTVGFSDPGDGENHNLNKSPRKVTSYFFPNDGTGAQLQYEPNGPVYPRIANPWGPVVGENDVNRIARGIVDETVVGVSKRQTAVNVPIAPALPSPTRQWNELPSTLNPQYPYCHVTETESGHLFIVDDTPGTENIIFRHRSGTFIEIHGTDDEQGTMVVKVVGKKYEVVMENHYAEYQNTSNVTVKGELNVYCQSNCNLQVDGDLNLNVGGNLNETIQGNKVTNIKGSSSTIIGSESTVSVSEDSNTFVGGNKIDNISGGKSVVIGGDETHNVEGNQVTIAGESMNFAAKVAMQFASKTTINGIAPTIVWDKGLPNFPDPPNPVPAQEPSVPAFPAPLNKWAESVFETGSEPTAEKS